MRKIIVNKIVILVLIIGIILILSRIDITNAQDERPELANALRNFYEAPKISGIEKWFNSEAIQISDLKGKVVLIDFWTYSCINCLRTLAHISALDKKYRDKGLVVIGVHAPEFDFEKDPQNVAAALKRFHINYPVALDNNLKTWKNFNNKYWPAHYLINQAGQVVYTHFGEGEYEVMENNVRALLAFGGEKVRIIEPQNSFFDQTTETYFGRERAERNVNESLDQLIFPKTIPLHSWALQGNWKTTDQFIESKNAGDSLKLNFISKKVFIVMASVSPKGVNVAVLLNGKPLGATKGEDVENSIVKVKNAKLYEVVNLEQKGNGTIEIRAGSAGLRIYATTFGDITR